jgi:2,4-diaminopentanoate dehydrogenase
MAGKYRVIQYGIGPIGTMVVRYLAGRPRIEIVGAVDADPVKIGRDLGDLAGLDAPLGVRVSGDATELLRRTQADAVVLTTVSSLEEAAPQVLDIVSSGKNIVSSCEELVYPWVTRPGLARAIDLAAKENRVSVLATGINPGFLMDFLPLVMTGICRNVRKVTAERYQDAQFRRLPFQKKIGVGLTPEEFADRMRGGTVRHVGLTESIHLIASGLGWQLERTGESLSAVIAQSRVTARDLTIEPGRVAGVRQIASGYRDGREAIALVFQAAVGEPNPHERIVIEGDPGIELRLNGVNGDAATCAIIVNAIPVVVEASPGLRTMADLRAVSCME